MAINLYYQPSDQRLFHFFFKIQWPPRKTTMMKLARKLGIKPGMKVLIRDAPSDFASLRSSLSDGIKLFKASNNRADCVIAFVRCKADVQAVAPTVLSAVVDDGLLWFAYPKKSSAVKSDLSRDSGWEAVFGDGFDISAQISIDETWTGFRLPPQNFA